MNNKKPLARLVKSYGLTLLEIIVSMTILALIMAGMVGLFTASRRHIVRSRSRMVQGELGRYFLEPLQIYVSQDTWTSGDPDINHLTIGTYRSPNNPDFATYTPVTWLDEPDLDGVTYYSAQRVENKDGLRKVVLTISYPSYD